MIASIVIIGIFGAIFLLTQSADVVRRSSLSIMWSALLLYPGVFAILTGRTVYGMETSSQWTALLSPAMYIFHLVTIAAGTLVLLLPRNEKYHLGIDSRVGIMIYFMVQLVALLLHSAWSGLTGWLTAAIVVVVLISAPESASATEKRLRHWLRAYVIASLLSAILLPEWALVPEASNSRALFGIEDRLIGFTSSSNYLGVVSALSFALEAGNTIRGDRRSKYFAFLALATCILTQSRSPIVAVGIILIFALAVRMQLVSLQRPKISVTLFTLAFASAFPILFLWFGNSRSEALLQEITTGRVRIWQTVYSMIRESPLVGHGPNVFTEDYWLQYSTSGIFFNAHNQWLESASRGGLLEVSGLFIFLLALLRLTTKARSSEFGFVVLAISVIIFVQLTIGTPFRISGITWNLVQLSALLGIAMASLADQESGEDTGHSGEKAKVGQRAFPRE